jgi:hypothetical protein
MSNFEEEQLVNEIAPGRYDFVTQADGTIFQQATFEGILAPIEISARFTDSPQQQYTFTHDREHGFNPNAWGGVGQILFYKSKDTPRGLVLKLTNANLGSDHYLTEVRAGKRLADPDNSAFASLFVVALNPNDGKQSKTVSFPVLRKGVKRETKFTVTVMERAKMNLKSMLFHKVKHRSLKAEDLAVMITFVEKVYCTLEGTEYFYKDMKLDQILFFGDEQLGIIEEQLKLGDLGNLCKTNKKDEQCEENLGAYVPAPAMELRLADALLWQKYLTISRIVLCGKHSDLFSRFMCLGPNPLTNETYRKVHTDLLYELTLKTVVIHEIDDLMKLEYRLFEKAMLFFKRFSEPMEEIDFEQFGKL